LAMISSSSRLIRILGSSSRYYTSRAHPGKIPEFAIGEAIEKILEDAEERRGKRVQKWDYNEEHRLKKGIETSGSYINQDETIEYIVNLNLDPRKPGQALRGSLSLPHTSGSSVTVAVFTEDKEVAKKALENGATFAGGQELVDQIVRGEVLTRFDRSLASQDMMGYLSKKVARTLGPRGLMPNAKVGTLVKTPDLILQGLKDQLAGQLQYRTDKTGIVHAPVGKSSIGKDKLLENIRVIIDELYQVKPESYGKGKKTSKSATYVLRSHVTSTQGRSYRVDLRTVDPASPFYMGDVEDSK